MNPELLKRIQHHLMTGEPLMVTRAEQAQIDAYIALVENFMVEEAVGRFNC